MSCAELLYHHQNLASGFPHHQRSISDVYSNYSNFTSASSAFNSDHNANSLMGGARAHSQHQGRDTSPANSALPGVVGATLTTSGHLSAAFPTSSSSSLGPAGHRPSASTITGSSPHRAMSSRHAEPPAPAGTYVTTPSSTPPLSSPPAAALTPSLPYFPAVTSSAVAASPPSSSSSSAFAFRPPTQELSPSATFATAPPPASSFFYPPPSHGHAYPSSPPYTPAASSKRSASEASDDLDDDALPKKTRYVNANCVLLTYHTKETSSEVDDHFSKALSVSSPCRYDSLGHTSSDVTSMAQRNFPPSFWDSNYYLTQQQQLYNAYSAYSAFPHPTGSQSASYLGHEALYPGLSAGWLGTAGSLQYPGLSSLQSKDPWGGFPFAAGSCSAGGSKGSSLGAHHHYPYSRLVAAGYPDHALPGGYGSGRLTSANFLFPSTSPSSASSTAVASPTSSTRPGHYLSATITSAAQCASGDPMGLRMTSLAGGLSRNQFASGGGLLAGQF